MHGGRYAGAVVGETQGEVATGTGFYYWKAKQENMIKLRQSQDKTQAQSGCVSPEDENFETFDAPQI